MNIEKPFFMQNSDWYYYDEEKGQYFLTDSAPEEAVKSYHDFYELLSSGIDLEFDDRSFID